MAKKSGKGKYRTRSVPFFIALGILIILYKEKDNLLSQVGKLIINNLMPLLIDAHATVASSYTFHRMNICFYAGGK